ncbi:MAG TPA: cobyric acid synthase [Kofleriaceae bacterium]|jgi:adenosylcobyric acid synthase|nr:cobyric acid synthase [Kofleriaceae bacterium]
MTAPTVMVQGTASSVGKSLLVTALCRLFRRAGLRVAPFKSQNMALNAAVTLDGLEIGRAQAVQADAAGLAATVDMNPILLKPEGDCGCQVVVLGKPIGRMTAAQYHAYQPQLTQIIATSLDRLRAEHDLVVIEGAGSPAEINLQAHDIANMHVARLAGAPVLLAGDIDRGGVFAAFVGTLELLPPDDRARIAAFIVNRFRGDRALLEPGLDMLTARTGVPVLGVVPYVPRLRIADEDSVSLDDRAGRRRPPPGELDIAVVRLPRIANHDDVEPLEHEPGVTVRFVDHPDELSGADLVVLPGSKNTTADLAWLRAAGLADAIVARAAAGDPILGVCGGCQMLGEVIEDPHGVESAEPRVAGLGLLPLATRFGRDKRTAQVAARAAAPSFLTAGAALAGPVAGYEIHMGVVEPVRPVPAAFAIEARHGRPAAARDGAVAGDGAIVGTMLHGLFDNDALRARTLAALRARRGLAAPAGARRIPTRQAEYDRLADAVQGGLDLDRLWRIAGAPRGT